MNNNPWLVDSIRAFSFLNCPECAFRSKEENLFAYHAAKNHPLSTAFFDKQIELEQSTIGLKTVACSPDSEEICESFDNDNEIQDETRQLETNPGPINNPMPDPNSNYESSEVVGSNTVASNPHVEPVSSVKFS